MLFFWLELKEPKVQAGMKKAKNVHSNITTAEGRLPKRKLIRKV